MSHVQIDNVISQMVSLFYYIGFWHRGDEPTAKELRWKFFYCIYYIVFVASMVVGSMISEKDDETIFMVESSITVGVFNVKLWFLIWKQKPILDLLHRICVFSIRYEEDFRFFNVKLRVFRKFVIFFCIMASVACLEVLLAPFIASKKIIIFEIGFPLDYKNSEIAFWIANSFILTECVLSMITTFFSILIWYLLLSCSLRYNLLGRELKRLGQIISEDSKNEISEKQKHTIFMQDLKASIDAHLHLKKLTDDLESFTSHMLFLQFGTSGLCICGSVYCLAFDVGDNVSKRCMHVLMLYYFISDLFMITYFGNEIMFSSSRVSYSLFESEWIEQPQSTKKNIIIFGEYLKQPRVLVIGKLYPLTLETFTRILNSAYSMFNILKSFQ
ncbi:odorant receptor 94b-like [Bradysia coprophila]|uniref:odorant receptor 94b-like n=1 Tax=Bradysia coprophila TaxID=38358 RepID=UPI00187DB9E3|nr:odorant receptor 94b-like [Bradysia coprophila]